MLPQITLFHQALSTEVGGGGSTHLALIIIIISHCYYFLRHSWQVTTFFNLALKESWLLLKIEMTLKGFIISHVKSSQQHILGSGDDYWVSHIKKCFWQWHPYQWPSTCLLWKQLASFAKKKKKALLVWWLPYPTALKVNWTETCSLLSAFHLPHLPGPINFKILWKGAWKMLGKTFF